MDFMRAEGMRQQVSSLSQQLFWCLVIVSTVTAQEPCRVVSPTAVFPIPYANRDDRFDTDPKSRFWSKASSAWILKDCSRELEYPELRTEVKGLWTDTHLYFLFVCPYRKLNVFLPARNDRPRDKLWDRDVVEMFLGDDWKNIRHYREFEIAPTGDWIDLAINLDSNRYDQRWRSGWQVRARIDEQAHRWFAAARIPLKSVSDTSVQPGTRWRMNLYRIEGEGPDSRRHFLCWQPTCVVNRDPNHVPEAFGTLVFEK
jgi:Carbohydrate family 9 binding domain-like